MRRSVSALVWLLVVWLAFGTLTVHAQGQDGDKVVVREDFVLLSDQVLNGDLAVIGGSATLEPRSVVQGDVAVIGGALTVAGSVRGNVAAFGGSVSLADTAVIEGSFAALTDSVQRAPGAVIRGDTIGAPGVRTVSSRPSGPGEALWGLVRWEIWTLGWVFVLASLGVAAVLVAPKPLAQIAGAASRQPAVSLAVGLLTLVVAAMGGAILLIVCGLGLLVWLATALGLLVGWVAVGMWLGRRILAALRVRAASSLVEVALGVALITVASRLPACIGFAAAVLVGALGLGAVVLTRFGTQPPGFVPPRGGGGGLDAAQLPIAEAPSVPIGEHGMEVVMPQGEMSLGQSGEAASGEEPREQSSVPEDPGPEA